MLTPALRLTASAKATAVRRSFTRRWKPPLYAESKSGLAFPRRGSTTGHVQFDKAMCTWELLQHREKTWRRRDEFPCAQIEPAAGRSHRRRAFTSRRPDLVLEDESRSVGTHGERPAPAVVSGNGADRDRVVRGNDHLVKLWNAADGQPGPILKGQESHVYNVAFHPAGGRLVS